MRGLYTPIPSPCTPLFPSIDSNVTYPVYTDMIIISSTAYGHVSWTWSPKPSDFVSTLCDVFSNLTLHLQHDIPQLLTLISGRVLTTSTDSGHPQMPQQSVMLTKFFRLSPIPLIELYKAKMYSTRSFCSRDTSVDRENLHWPNGITHSANDIIIADGGNHRIVVFTNRGNFSHAFRHHLLSRPYGICIRHDRNSLIVTAWESNFVIIFKLGYGLLGTWTIRYGQFGTDDSVPGQFGTGQFGTWTVRYMDSSVRGQFGTYYIALHSTSAT